MPGHWTATLPPPSSRYTAEQLAKFEEYQKRQSKAHPLYSTSASEIGKVPRGVTVQLRPPEHGLKRAAHRDAFVPPHRDSGLTTSITKHRFLKELDPM